MASADDPLANAYNIMGAQGLTNPNPYLEYTGQIPMAGFMGTPTDASGNPIQSYLQAMQGQGGGAPGTTLNSPPAAAQPNMNQWAINNAMIGVPAGTGPGTQLNNAVDLRAQNNAAYGVGLGPGGSVPTPASVAAQQASAPAAVPQASGPNMRQAYLDALSNPGHVTTPGAVMQPGATTGAPQPSVLQAFLAAHPQGGTSISGKGGGGYSNQSFFNTLANLQAAKGAAA